MVRTSTEGAPLRSRAACAAQCAKRVTFCFLASRSQQIVATMYHVRLYVQYAPGRFPPSERAERWWRGASMGFAARRTIFALSNKALLTKECSSNETDIHVFTHRYGLSSRNPYGTRTRSGIIY